MAPVFTQPWAEHLTYISAAASEELPVLAGEDTHSARWQPAPFHPYTYCQPLKLYNLSLEISSTQNGVCLHVGQLQMKRRSGERLCGRALLLCLRYSEWCSWQWGGGGGCVLVNFSATIPLLPYNLQRGHKSGQLPAPQPLEAAFHRLYPGFCWVNYINLATPHIPIFHNMWANLFPLYSCYLTWYLLLSQVSVVKQLWSE